MKRVLVRLSLAVLACAAVALAGCVDTGDWAKFSKHKGDVTYAKKGWGVNKVLTTVGQPDHIRRGENIGTGWEEWVYPKGSIIMYRMEVFAVESRDEKTDIGSHERHEAPEKKIFEKKADPDERMEGFVPNEK